jgi:hypothetical protein
LGTSVAVVVGLLYLLLIAAVNWRVHFVCYPGQKLRFKGLERLQRLVDDGQKHNAKKFVAEFLPLFNKRMIAPLETQVCAHDNTTRPPALHCTFLSHLCCWCCLCVRCVYRSDKGFAVGDRARGSSCHQSHRPRTRRRAEEGGSRVDKDARRCSLSDQQSHARYASDAAPPLPHRYHIA